MTVNYTFDKYGPAVHEYKKKTANTSKWLQFVLQNKLSRQTYQVNMYTYLLAQTDSLYNSWSFKVKQ